MSKVICICPTLRDHRELAALANGHTFLHHDYASALEDLSVDECARQEAANSRKCSEMFGNGRRALTRGTRAMQLRRVPLANTMASSCATNTCSAVVRAPPLRTIFGGRIEISSRRISVGSLWESGWQGVFHEN